MIYLVIGVFFVIWVIFFDDNSYLAHQDLNRVLDSIRVEKKNLENAIEKDRQILEELQENPDALERLARENYYFKKEGEEIFIIGHEEDESSH